METEGWSALVEPCVILLILFANAVVAIAQDSNSEKALAELIKMQVEACVVIRDGRHIEISTQSLVPGDIVELRPGNMVPADCRVVKMFSLALKATQAGLTGETHSVEKFCAPVEASADGDLGINSQTNMLFSATTIGKYLSVSYHVISCERKKCVFIYMDLNHNF